MAKGNLLLKDYQIQIIYLIPICKKTYLDWLKSNYQIYFVTHSN
jgi:hypothetical protein